MRVLYTADRPSPAAQLMHEESEFARKRGKPSTMRGRSKHKAEMFSAHQVVCPPQDALPHVWREVIRDVLRTYPSDADGYATKADRT